MQDDEATTVTILESYKQAFFDPIKQHRGRVVGERIYGDGVNIAARLESIADPGGICVSKTAFDHIETKLPFGYEYLGEQTVKNIAKPVGAYRVVLESRITSGKSTRPKVQRTGPSVNPNEAAFYFILGMVLRTARRFEEAILNLETALRLAPLRPIN